MGKKRRTGVSTSVTTFRASSTVLPLERTRRLATQALAEERRESRARVLQSLSGLSRQNIEILNLNVPHSSDYDVSMDHGDWEDVVEGVTGETQSAGEDGSVEQNVFYDLRDLVTSQWTERHFVDHRTWKSRRETFFRNWEKVLEATTNAYLHWRQGGEPSTSDDCPENVVFTVDCVDLFTLKASISVSRPPSSISPVVDLARAGYLANSPDSPSLAISIKTLEFFRVIRLFRPSFSVEAFAKTICYFYSQPYRRRYRTALSDTFDVYLTLQRQVNLRLNQFLGRDTPNYRVQHACPACNYELEGEPALIFSRMLAMDGNNSLKRIKGIGNRQSGDTRRYDESDYFLTPEYVDKFAYEVKSREKPPTTVDDSDQIIEHTDEGDPTDGDSRLVQSSCTENWKAAAKDEKKKMWAIFDEAGIFASACRHGFILWIADMIRSGELAKYPLAIVAHAMKIFGPRLMFGFDIGCTFQITTKASSLGQEFIEKGCRFCVDAFHGYSHNYLCQLFHHPNSIPGMGLEDLETLERIFSASNALGSITRYMTAYRRRVFIDLHFQQWDTEKYANLATMLYNNYRQALSIIQDHTLDIDKTLELKNIDEATLDRYIEDERLFFSTLGQEPEGDLHAVAYVEMLDDLWDVEKKLDEASSRFLTQTPQDYHFISPEQSYAQGLSETRRADTARRQLNERRNTLLHDIIQIEDRMNVTSRWTPASSEYQKTAKYIADRTYERALDKLQKLVIQRLFELHKLNLSNTGYRARTHIAKSLQSRSSAIRNAVREHNVAALRLNQPTLDWQKVSHYSFLDEFNILRNTRSNVQEKPWADPVIRETMRKYQRLHRAREEIVRCNVEVRRLHTSIIDEDEQFSTIFQKLDPTDLLYVIVADFINRRRAINKILLQRISQIYALDGFSGIPEPGLRKGSVQSPPITSNLTAANTTPPSDVQPEPVHHMPDLSESDGDDPDDAALGDLGGVIDYVANIS